MKLEDNSNSDSYQQDTIQIKIDPILLLRAKSELTMSIDEFVEYALTMYLRHEDSYAKLFYDGAKHYTALKKIQTKMGKLEKNANDDSSYEQAMETVSRIHGNLDHIGKDKLRKIAADNDIGVNDFINHVISLGEYNVTNYTATMK